MASTTASRNQALLRALSHRSSPDFKVPSELSFEDDLKALFLKFLSISGNETKLTNKDEVMKWVDFASSFLAESGSSLSKLEGLNEDLAKKSVLLGDGFKTSEADVVVYSALHSSVSNLPISERQRFSNLLRWLDYIQNKEDFGEFLEKLHVEKATFEPPAIKVAEKLVPAKDASYLKNSEKIENKTQHTKATSEACDDNKISEAKNVEPQKESGKDTDVSVSLLNIQVGCIRKAWKHPSADSLLVEEIDVGDRNIRQVVSGLAKYCTPEELTNRLVVLVTNVKPGKLRDVMSAGLVLCASNEDHTVVEPLLPPQGALPGERVSFAGYEGKPEDVLNPKKKQLEKITPHLHTDSNGVATFKGIPFMTSCGPCTASIPNAGIK